MKGVNNYLLTAIVGFGHAEKWASSDTQLTPVFYEDNKERKWRHELGGGKNLHTQEGIGNNWSRYRWSTGMH